MTMDNFTTVPRFLVYKHNVFMLRVSRLRAIQESPPQFENQIMARVYVRSIMHSTMNQKAPFC